MGKWESLLECLQKDKLCIDVENVCCGSIEMWRVVMLSTSSKVAIEALCGANSCRFVSESNLVHGESK